MLAPRFSLVETERLEWPFRLRVPFRFGVITVTQGRQAVLRARIRLADGREAWGVAAETLAAKWCDKDPPCRYRKRTSTHCAGRSRSRKRRRRRRPQHRLRHLRTAMRRDGRRGAEG